MASFEQTFLEQITSIQGVDFYTWQGWRQLMEWVKRQPWRSEFIGGDKIPSRFMHPATLADSLVKYLQQVNDKPLLCVKWS